MTKRGWKTRPLAEVAEVIRGVSFDKGEARDASADGLVPILRAGNIGETLDTENDLIWVAEERVTEQQLLRVGDVAIAMSSGSSNIVGKTAQLNEEWRGAVGAFCAVVRFGDEIIPRFGAYWMKSAEFVSWRLSQSRGANIQNLQKSSLEKISIPFPSLPEQQRLVHILDEADALRQLRRRADARTNDFIPALFNEMFGDPATNPKGWEKGTLGRIGGQGQYGLNAAAMSEGTGVRYVRITDIDAQGRLEGAEPAFVPADTENLERYELQEGDILIARSGATAGKSYVHLDLPFRAVYAGYLIRFQIDRTQALPTFVANFLQTSEYWSQLNTLKRAVAQPNVNAKQLASIGLPLPPIPLQREFAARVAEMRAIETQQAKSRERLDDLFQSLLSRAFAGEL